MAISSRTFSGRSIRTSDKRTTAPRDVRSREQNSKEYENILNDLKADFDARWHKTSKTNDHAGPRLEDFDRLKTLGTGAFGRVLLVKHKFESKYYAMKVLEKAKLVKLKQVGFLFFWSMINFY